MLFFFTYVFYFKKSYAILIMVGDRMTKQTKKASKTVAKKKEVQKHQKKEQSNGTKFLCLFVVVVAFTIAFVVLINKQKDDAYYANMKGNGFSIKPEEGKTIVAKDLNAIYPKYYVIYVNDDEFSLYVFNYYETVSQYNLEFNRLIDKIVDYNAKEKMIRYLHSRGYGTYSEVLNNLDTLVESDNLLIY